MWLQGCKERCDAGFGVNATTKQLLDFASAMTRYGKEKALVTHQDANNEALVLKLGKKSFTKYEIFPNV